MEKNIRLKIKDRFLTDIFIAFMSCMIMIYMNMCHNQTFLSGLNFDYGLAELMKGIFYFIIVIFIIFYCYLSFWFWKKISYQIGIFVLSGGNKRKLVLTVVIKRFLSSLCCIISGTALGLLFYTLLVWRPEQNICSSLIIQPILISVGIFAFGDIMWYMILKNCNVMSLIKLRKERFRNTDLKIAGRTLSAVLMIAGGMAGIIKMKESDIVVTSFLYIVPVIMELAGVYLFAGSLVLIVMKRKNNEEGILFLEYIRCNSRILSLVLGCVAVTAFLIVFVTSTVLSSNDIISMEVLEYDKPFDVVFDLSSVEIITDYLEKIKGAGADVFNISYLDGYLRWSSDAYDLPVIIISQSDYRKIGKENVNLENGSTIILSQVNKDSVMVTTEDDGTEWSFIPPGEIKLLCGKVHILNLINERWQILFNLPDQGLRTFIVTDEDYQDFFADGNKETDKVMINYKGSRKARQIAEAMLQKIHLDNLLQKKAEISSQFAERKIMAVFTYLTDAILLVCLFVFQILRLISEKESWEHNRRILVMIGIDKGRLNREIKKRMNYQTLYPAMYGGVVGIVFSGIYVRNINLKMSLLLFAAFMVFLLLEVCFDKYGAATLMQRESKRTNKTG